MTTLAANLKPLVGKKLTDPEIKKTIQELRQADNWTNWLYRCHWCCIYNNWANR